MDERTSDLHASGHASAETLLDTDGARAGESASAQTGAVSAGEDAPDLLGALAALDFLAAAVQRATATLRWGSDDAEALAAAMSEINRRVGEAQASLKVREITTEPVPNSPQPRLAPEEMSEGHAGVGAEVTPETTDFPYPAESYLVGASRSMEAIRSLADQALLGFIIAPQEQGVFIETFYALKQRLATVERDYTHYVLASEARAQ